MQGRKGSKMSKKREFIAGIRFALKTEAVLWLFGPSHFTPSDGEAIHFRTATEAVNAVKRELAVYQGRDVAQIEIKAVDTEEVKHL